MTDLDALLGPELIIALGITVPAGSLLPQRLQTGRRLFPLAAGELLGFAPAFRAVQLPSTVVLFVFLPALLYWESLTTSLRAIRADLRRVLTAPRWSSCPRRSRSR